MYVQALPSFYCLKQFYEQRNKGLYLVNFFHYAIEHGFYHVLFYAQHRELCLTTEQLTKQSVEYDSITISCTTIPSF